MALGNFNRLLGRLSRKRGDAQAWYERGEAALRAGALDDARAALVEAVNLAPEHLARAFAAGELLASAGCLGEADLGMALLSAKRLPQALLAFARARELDQSSAQAHCGLGLVYQQLGRWWEAADAYRRAEQLAPTDPAAPNNLAAVLHIL